MNNLNRNNISEYSQVIPESILNKTIQDIWAKVQRNIKPPPDQSVSEWADEYRFLSPEDSKKALLGDPKWNHEGFEYLKGFEDAFNDPLVRKISVMKSGQTGYTQAMINQMHYAICNAPGPMIVLYPTEGNAEKFSKRKFEPSIRDTPAIKEKISDQQRRDGQNSTLEKSFPGGFVSILSAATVNNLAQQSIMYLFIDELDRIARTAGMEGDTVDIIRKRLQGFMEISKEVDISTPTIKRSSRIEAEYELSNKQKYYVPCSKCGEYQILKFAQLQGWRKSKGVYVPEETYYECEFCKSHLTERDKFIMIKYGKWIAENPEVIAHSGFWINELYSTISTWQYVIEQFTPAKENPHKLQVFVNTVLGETFEDNEAEIPDNVLMQRTEDYNSTKIPEGVLILTAAGDVQKDRIEIGIKGWGLGEESWLIDYKIFNGDPEMPYDSAYENNLWYRVEQYLDSKFESESGIALRIMSAGIDTGWATTAVQRFIKKMHRKGKAHIFALQGDKGMAGAPILNRGSINNKLRVKQYSVGTATAKNIIFSRLTIDEYGPGYMHFPNTLDSEYFKQLTAEKRVPVYDKGIVVRNKWIKVRARNEALDVEVYNLAALEFLNVNLQAVHKNRNIKLERIKKEKTETKIEPEKVKETTLPNSNEETKDLRQIRHKKIKSRHPNNWATNY